MSVIPHRKKMRRRGSPGFSLIELLVYMFIATMAIIVLTNFMVDITKQAAIGRTRKEVLDNARFVMTRLTNDIRSAKSVAAITDPAVLNLMNASDQSVTYRWTGTSVEYTDPAGTVVLTTDKVRVTNLSFANLSGMPDEVTIELDVEQLHPGAQLGMQYTSHLRVTAVRRRSLY